MTEQTRLDVFVVLMQKQRVLLAEDSVAEIIAYEPLQRIEDTPDWFLGLLGWRGVQVPVVSFEMLTIPKASFSLVSVASASLVIVRGTNDQVALPFYALVAQTYPIKHALSQEMLFELGEVVERTELCRVRFRNDVLSIANLEYIEAALLNTLVK